MPALCRIAGSIQARVELLSVKNMVTTIERGVILERKKGTSHRY